MHDETCTNEWHRRSHGRIRPEDAEHVFCRSSAVQRPISSTVTPVWAGLRKAAYDYLIAAYNGQARSAN